MFKCQILTYKSIYYNENKDEKIMGGIMNIERGFAIIIGISIIIFAEVFRYIRRKKANIKFWTYKEIGLILLKLYIVALISVTLFPFHTLMELKPSANIVPVFSTIKDMTNVRADMHSFMIKFWIINIVGNLILLLPLATIVPLISKKYRNIKSIVLLCFSVSIIIEFLQYISMYFGNRRSVDIDDVILNTLGALIGFAIFKLINRKVLKNV